MDVQYLKGVGPKMSELLKKIGISNIKDLIEYYPRTYEDRTKLCKISELIVGDNCLFMARVSSSMSVKRIKKNLAIYSCFVSDETGVCKLTWFNQSYIREKIHEGATYLFFGKPEWNNGGKNVDSAIVYNLDDIEKVQGVYPIYNLTAGVTQNYIFKLMNLVFSNKPSIVEFYDESFRKKYGLCEINYAMEKIHFPKSFRDVSLARNRIIFDELFLLQLALLSRKNSMIRTEKSTKFFKIDITEFTNLLPFELTNAQKRVIGEIAKDMYSSKIMNRLVQGDVGSGKTMIAAVAMYIAVKNGYQSTIMAPTTILANQHYDELNKYFSKLNINVEIITSSTTKKKKENIISRLKSHEIDILVGTHSLIEDNIEFENLGLVITDEQHRFGVNQRLKLTNKGKSVETLVMTATPIPRTMSIVLYGDLDLSIVDEMPAGRKPIKTYVVNDALEERVNTFLKKQINEGRQIYVVCPLVEDNETLDLKSVEILYQKYKNEDFKEYNVEFLHGKMKNKEKDEIMQRFKNNEVNILISTTVIEVGISVSNATVMVIENADRFGLAALHQLRGRVGRGIHQSFCILKSNNKSVNSRQRLKIMEKSNNGFEIAQKDLEIRGPGDYFGIRQSGLPEFKLANLLTDIDILNKTQEAAKEIILDDPTLSKHPKLKYILEDKYKEQLFIKTT